MTDISTIKGAKLRHRRCADLFRQNQIERGIEPLATVPGEVYIRPGKILVFVAARGFGEEAGEFYEHPGDYWLAGTDSKDMMRRLAAAFAWPSPKALDDAILQAEPGGTPFGPMTDEESFPHDPPAQLEAPLRPRSRWRAAAAALTRRLRLQGQAPH